MVVYHFVLSYQQRLPGQPRSLILVQFESAYVTSISYWSVATLVQSCTVSEIWWLKSRKITSLYPPESQIALACGDPFRILWWAWYLHELESSGFPLVKKSWCIMSVGWYGCIYSIYSIALHMISILKAWWSLTWTTRVRQWRPQTMTTWWNLSNGVKWAYLYIWR